MTLPVIVIGGGGHSRVLIDSLLRQSHKVLGFTDIEPQVQLSSFRGIPCLGNDGIINNYAPSEIGLVNGMGSIGSVDLRKRIYETFIAKGYSFPSIIHPSAIIASDVIFGEGVQVMAGAIIQTSCRIGNNTIINTRASVDHDCVIGANVHIAPGVTLSGGITVGDSVHIGCGATIIQQVNLHESSIIGAGAVVLNDVPAHRTYVGVPAKEVHR